MPIDQEKVDNFSNIFKQFDPNGIHKLAKSDFSSFINSFTVLGKAPPENEEEEEDLESESEINHMTFIGADFFDSETSKFLWKSLDVKNTGYITEKVCLYCVKGLSGYFKDFTLKVFFRVLDTKKVGLVSNNELRKMKYLKGIALSEDEMIKKFEKKLGREIDEVNYRDFFFCFKGRQPEDQTAYDPEVFDVYIGIDEKKGGCCRIM